MVDVNGTSSKAELIKCGVPQGSILGPLFFLLYINDISACIVEDIEMIMFADDISLVVHSKTKADSVMKKID